MTQGNETQSAQSEQNQGCSNVFDNPFPILSPVECVETIKRMREDPSVDAELFDIRMVQLQKTNPRGYAMVNKEGLV